MVGSVDQLWSSHLGSESKASLSQLERQQFSRQQQKLPHEEIHPKVAFFLWSWNYNRGQLWRKSKPTTMRCQLERTLQSNIGISISMPASEIVHSGISRIQALRDFSRKIRLPKQFLPHRQIRQIIHHAFQLIEWPAIIYIHQIKTTATVTYE